MINDIYSDISKRTDGDIYIGVVGPVRTGKSTFIKNFMDLLVIPNIENEYKAIKFKRNFCMETVDIGWEQVYNMDLL